MTYPSRFLKSTSPPAADASSANETVDSDFVVILAALLCALICVLGLVAVARCAWIRRLSGGVGGHSASHSSANKGLKKKVLRSLPKLTFSDDLASKLADCPICLSEFVAGDEIRVLPQCGHAFHVVCVDTWLGSHSSCPSCRQILAVGRCQRCGGLPADTSPASEPPVTESVIEVGGVGLNTFLP